MDESHLINRKFEYFESASAEALKYPLRWANPLCSATARNQLIERNHCLTTHTQVLSLSLSLSLLLSISFSWRFSLTIYLFMIVTLVIYILDLTLTTWLQNKYWWILWKLNCKMQELYIFLWPFSPFLWPDCIYIYIFFFSLPDYKLLWKFTSIICFCLKRNA